MERRDVAEAGGNVDQRLARIEQILPTLPTKEDLKPLATKDGLREAVAKLATKDELHEAVSKLATKDELREAVEKLATKDELRDAVEKLATKDELREATLATKDELRETESRLATTIGQVKQGLEQKIQEEGDRSRRYMKILVEEVKDRVDLYAERMTTVDERDARQHAESVEAAGALDKRVTVLEASSRRRRR